MNVFLMWDLSATAFYIRYYLLMYAARKKRKIATEDRQQVRKEYTAEIEDANTVERNGSRSMRPNMDQSWSNSSAATSASVPQPQPAT